jgi:NADH:ubiquinone oxidoreductase subunit 2 (subunit N)
MGSYYYLRLIVRMYMFEPRTEAPTPKVQLGVGLAIAISLIATLWLGVLPNVVLHYTQGAPTILAAH